MASFVRWILRTLRRCDCRKGTYRIPKTGLRKDVTEEYSNDTGDFYLASDSAEIENSKTFDVKKYETLDNISGDFASQSSTEDNEIPSESLSNNSNTEISDERELQINFDKNDTADHEVAERLDGTDHGRSYSEEESQERESLNEVELLTPEDQNETDYGPEQREQENFDKKIRLIPYISELETEYGSEENEESLDEVELKTPEEDNSHHETNFSKTKTQAKNQEDDEIVILNDFLELQVESISDQPGEEAIDAVDIFLEDDVPLQLPYRDMQLKDTLDGTLRTKTVRSDVLVVIGDREFRAHQRVLRSNSKYFAERLGGQRQCVVQIAPQSVSPQAFEAIMTFMYTGEMTISSQLIAQVLNAAFYLGVEDAVTKCRQMTEIASMDFMKIVRLYVTASNLDLTDPKEHALELMASNFEEIVKQSEYLELTKDQLMDFLTKDSIGARSETMVFLAALKWLNYDFLLREGHTIDVLGCVRFSSMTKEELLTSFHPPVLPGLVEIQEVKQNMLEALCYISATEHGIEGRFANMASKPRQLLLRGKPLILWGTSVFEPDYVGECGTIQARGQRKRLLECREEDYSEWRRMEREDSLEYGEYQQLEEAETSSGIRNITDTPHQNYKGILKWLHYKKHRQSS